MGRPRNEAIAFPQVTANMHIEMIQKRQVRTTDSDVGKAISASTGVLSVPFLPSLWVRVSKLILAID